MRFSISRIGIGLLCLSTIGCQHSPNLPVVSTNVFTQAGDQVKIREVQSSKPDRLVRVQGKIKAQVALAGGQRAYEVQDETASVWVVTGEKLPATGSEVGIQGKVRSQKIDIGGQDQSTVYLEQRGTVEVLPARGTGS